MRRVAQMFAAAKVIMAPHGGTLSNLLFRTRNQNTLVWGRSSPTLVKNFITLE